MYKWEFYICYLVFIRAITECHRILKCINSSCPSAKQWFYWCTLAKTEWSALTYKKSRILHFILVFDPYTSVPCPIINISWEFYENLSITFWIISLKIKLTQNIQICAIITPKHMRTKQHPTRLSCSQKNVCCHTRCTPNFQQKAGWPRGHVCLFTAILPLYVSLCVWIVFRCLFFMLRW